MRLRRGKLKLYYTHTICHKFRLSTGFARVAHVATPTPFEDIPIRHEKYFFVGIPFAM